MKKFDSAYIVNDTDSFNSLLNVLECNDLQINSIRILKKPDGSYEVTPRCFNQGDKFSGVSASFSEKELKKLINDNDLRRL